MYVQYQLTVHRSNVSPNGEKKDSIIQNHSIARTSTYTSQHNNITTLKGHKETRDKNKTTSTSKIIYDTKT